MAAVPGWAGVRAGYLAPACPRRLVVQVLGLRNRSEWTIPAHFCCWESLIPDWGCASQFGLFPGRDAGLWAEARPVKPQWPRLSGWAGV